MLHSLVLQLPAFVIPQCLFPLPRSRCHHAQMRFGGVRAFRTSADQRHLRPPALKDAGSASDSETRNPNTTTAGFRESNDELEDILSTTGNSLGLLPVFARDGNGVNLEGIAVGGQHGNAIFVDLSLSGYVPKSLVEVLQSNSVEKCGCFLRELYKHLLTEHDISMNGAFFDAHVALDLLNAEEKEMREVASATTASEAQVIAVSELLSNRTSPVPQYTVDDAVSLCSLLTRVTLGLRRKLRKDGLLRLAVRVEFPLIRVLGSMEIKGVPVDRAKLAGLRTRYGTRLSEIEEKTRDLLNAHGSQSTNGPVSMVFDSYFARYDKTNKAYRTGAKSTATRSELESMASNVELPSDYRILANLLIQHEDISKFIERDIIPLSRHVEGDGRVRTTFVQGSCATGRLATRNPNLQNIPVRSQLGRELRNTFRAVDGVYLLRADYSQIELRIVASLCGDPFMLDAFSSGTDIHRCIAGKIFGISADEVTSSQRKHAKQVIYSILYGVSSLGLSERLAVPVRAAENLLSEFRIEFPAVQALSKQLVEEATKNGYAKTLLGRRLPLPILVRGEPSERRVASRRAVNMPIQGTQADMIKLSMVRIHERLQTRRLKSTLVLQVHDELILEVPDYEIEQVVSLVEEEMISALPLTSVDVAVQIRYGPSWSTSVQPVSRS